MDGNLADGNDGRVLAAGERFRADDAFGGSREGIATQRHGRGAGMVRMTGQGDGKPGLASDGRDGGGGLVEFLQHPALLDVEFDVAACAARRVVDGGGVFVPAFGREGVGNGFSISVRRSQGGCIQRSNDRAGTEVGCLKSHAFLVGKSEDMNGKRQRDILLSEHFQGGYRRNDAKRSVIFSCIDHGIVMRA